MDEILASDDIATLANWLRILNQESSDLMRQITSLKKKLMLSEQENTKFIMKMNELQGTVVPLIKEN